MESDGRPPKRLRPMEGIESSNADGLANYDVFISHRGPDTKTGFVSFLHRDLEAAGLLPFLDCKSIDIGDDSWECIEHAIRITPIAVVVFSESFAQSEWCLRELHVMLHTPSVKVLLVFYKVRPSEVRFPESGQLKDGFQKLIGRHDKNIIEQWRADLDQASKLMGWEHAGAQGRLEGDLVKEIVEKILDLANKPLPLFVGDYVVGTKKVVEDIIQIIDTKKTILMLGLWGMGGIGKSTLARELYNRLRRGFDASGYIEDVTEKVLHGGVVKVQNLILKDLCTNEAHVVEDKSKGRTILEERLSKKRVLIVLDDVCDSDAMGFWITRKMLSIGSLCIVTSRDRRVIELSGTLDMNEEMHIQHVQGLSNVDSKQVFASYAFGGVSKVKPELERMVASISKACGGVPLVLKVCGALLKHEVNVLIWNEVLKKLNTGTIMDEEKIFECLRMSYDSLKGQYREMFLDISCALIGERCSYAISFWNAREWSASLGVRTLVEKALVTVDKDGRFNMHDHLRDMGREIERKGRMDDGGIKRLWMPKFLELLKEDGELPTSLQTLIIHNYGFSYNPYTQEHQRLDLDVSHLKELRIFICKGDINVSSSLPKNLSWICSRKMNIFPIIPQMNKLVILDLECSSIQAMCESVGNATKLEVLTLSSFSKLSSLPHSFGMLKRLRDIQLVGSGIQSLPESFGELSNLEVLNLSSCSRLSSLPHSFGMLKRLRDINLKRSGIESLPESFGELSNLEVLDLSFCSQLSSLPHSFGMLKRLRDINLEDCWIQSLPEWFRELSNLEVLDLSSCSRLSSLPHSFGMLKRLRDIQLVGSGIQSLPESFGELSNLEVLNLSSCSRLSSLPHSFGMLKRLRDINLKRSGIESLPESFGELSNLEVLDLSFCSQLSSLPHSFGMLKRLRDINLEDCWIQSLPEWFRELSNLEVLDLSFCSQLSSLPHSFGMLKRLRDINLYNSGIESLPESFGELSNLEVLNMAYCIKLSSLPHSFGMLKKLPRIDLGASGMDSLPESIGELSNLEVLDLRRCSQLCSLPHSFGMLKRFRDINLWWSGIESLPESFGELSNLEVLNLGDCFKLRSLPHSFGMLKRLRDFNLGGSGIESLPESFGELSNLEALDLRRCSQLSSLPHSFGMLKRLSKINLWESGIRSLPESFGELSNLELFSAQFTAAFIWDMW
ncbi:hypothetical protein KC19_11G047400 [Ceratodon purpureus]|uniref:TIR domain-containing protein n=1 Tax=Ceratodon purpureus TaxID=3225 RepID=A0A8T0GEV3_CERPU|nr:hypothetical protein KC19_11G047400 [Ceratodon purpureus]